MTAELNLHADLSEVNDKCALLMNPIYEDLPNACNAPPPAIPNYDADASYIFVSSTDAATTDHHLSSDPNWLAKRDPNADIEIQVKVQNGESTVEDARKPESCLLDAHVSDALEDSQVIFSNQVKESDSVQDEIRAADILQSSHTKVDEVERGFDSSQNVEETRILDHHGRAAVDQFSVTEANHAEEFQVESPPKFEDIQIPEENQINAVSESSDADANRGEELEVESAQMADEIQIHDDDGIVAIIEMPSSSSSETDSNHAGESEVESSHKADDFQNLAEKKPLEIKFSDAEANCGVEIEVESSRKTDVIQIHEETGSVATVKSSDTEANPREELEPICPGKVEDNEIQGQNDAVANIQSFDTIAICGGEIEVKSSHEVEDIQISEDNGMVVTNELSDTMDNHGEEIEVESFVRVENIQESQNATLKAADCNRVNGREKIEEIENKSQLSDPVEIGESRITSMSYSESEPDQSYDSVENVKECKRTQITTSKDGEDNWVVVEDQVGSSVEVPLLEPSVENTVEIERDLAAVPCLQVNLKFETDNPNGCISVGNEDGLPTSMDQDIPLGTIDDTDTVAKGENTKTSSLSSNCEIAIVETTNLTRGKLSSYPEENLNEITTDEQEVNRALEQEDSHEIASCPIIDDCAKIEVLEGIVSENGGDMPIAPDDSKFPNADDSAAAIQLPAGNEPLESIETRVSSIMIGRTLVEISERFSTQCLNGPVLKPEVTKSENVASAVNDVQPELEVGEDPEIDLLRNSDLETKIENGHAEKDNQSYFPSNDAGSESSPCMSIGSEEKVSTVSEVPNGDNESSVSQPNSIVHTDSELHDNESSSIPCSATNEKSGHEVVTTSSTCSRDMAGDDCKSEILKGSLVNDDGELNTMAHVVYETDDKPEKGETEVIHERRQDQPLSISPEASSDDALEGQNAGAEAGSRPFYYLVRVPRFDDEKIREQIKSAQSEVERKTQDRDAIRVQIQTLRATCKGLSDNLEAAVSEERTARNSLKLKRQEMDSVQSQITKVKNAMSVEDIDSRIRSIDRMIEHETLPLKEEKQLIREIKQLKQLREQLSLAMGKEDELQQVLDQKDQIEERLKILRKEVDLLRDNVVKAESVTKGAKKKYHDENVKLDELQTRFKAADKIRQEAYANLHNMKKQLYEKNKYLWKYRDDVKEADDLALTREKEKLQHLCVNQVETLMELWNKNDEFRKEYIRCNMRSTLRRLRTLDGRSLGPDEFPSVLTNIVKEKSARDSSLSTVSTQERQNTIPAETTKDNDKPVIKIVETKNPTTKNKKQPDKAATVASHTTTISDENEVEEAREKEIERTKEEEELAAKAEELRKEEEAAKLKELRKIEEQTKAKEALERKKRNAERAQARAATKARKEAEERDKQREKREKKKERKMAAGTEAENGFEEKESTEVDETPTEAPKVSDNTGKPAKKSRNSLQYTKQSKARCIPPPLRHRGKRRMQLWMWVLLTALVLGLFFVGHQYLTIKS